MSPPRKKASSSDFVTRRFCDERFGRIMDKLETIDGKVSGLINDIKEERKQRSRDWISFAISITSGIVVAIVAWLLSSVV